LHVIANLNVGEVGLADGAMMAAADHFRIDVKGAGGHGAQPHITVDALVAGARIVVDLQNIVSRMIDPMSPAVVTIGKFQSGNAFNIIQEHAVLEGTVRTLDDSVRNRIEQAIRQTAEAVCMATGACFQLEYTRGYPPLINHKEMTALARKAAERLGFRTIDVVPAMYGEDFSYYLQKVPGCYFFIGCSNPSKGLVSPNHSPNFLPDEESLAISALMLLETGLEFLNSKV
jgi:amidohydrolase